MIENTKECKICHKLLSADYEGDVCPHCQEEDLFMRVKDYIRSNVVNEYMVADHFQISIKKVRNWIKEGRIEYVEKDTQIVGTKCQRCGKPVSFGTLCPDCMRLMNYNNKKSNLHRISKVRKTIVCVSWNNKNGIRISSYPIFMSLM